MGLQHRVEVDGDIEPDVGALGWAFTQRTAIVGHGGVDGKQPGPLLKEAIGRVTVGIDRDLGGRHQPALDLIGLEPGFGLEKQRRRAGRNGGCLGGSRHDEVLVRVVEFRVVGGDLVLLFHHAEKVPTGRYDLRFDESFHSGTGGGKGRQEIVGEDVGRVVVGHRPDCHRVRAVARHAHGHRVRTRVAGRCHDNDAGLPRRHDRLVERIVPVMRLRLCRERAVQHPDVVLILVRNHPVDAADDVEV